MNTSASGTHKIILAGVSALALAASPVAFDALSQHGVFSKAAAQQSAGQGQRGKPGQGGQQGGGRGGQSAGSQGGAGSTQDSLRGSKPATTGGKPASAGSGSSGSSSSATKLGRLSMAKSFLSPGFDITKVDDPDAPIAQIYAYSLVIAAPLPADDPATTENETDVAINAAGVSLGTAATVVPVTLSTVKAVNSAAGFTTTWSDEALSQVAAIATTTVESRRTEEGEGE